MEANLSKSKGKRGTTYCSALNCNSNKIDNKELSFFRFPKDVNRSVVVKVHFLLPFIVKISCKNINLRIILTVESAKNKSPSSDIVYCLLIYKGQKNGSLTADDKTFLGATPSHCTKISVSAAITLKKACSRIV